MPLNSALRVSDLQQNTPTPFDLRPDPKALQALAQELGLSGLRKLRFSGQIVAQGRKDWRLVGQLGATVVQPCVVTLDPVTTRIDVPVERLYIAGLGTPDETEVEMPEDDSVEPLGPVIDPAVVMAEALALALPLYPRKDEAGLDEAVFTEPGKPAMRDEDARPFAGLADLRDQLSKKD